MVNLCNIVDLNTWSAGLSVQLSLQQAFRRTVRDIIVINKLLFSFYTVRLAVTSSMRKSKISLTAAIHFHPGASLTWGKGGPVIIRGPKVAAH